MAKYSGHGLCRGRISIEKKKGRKEMDFKKVLSALLALCLVFCLLPAAAFAEGEQTSTGSFTAASMNVDGLPQIIFVVEINSDGPGPEGTKKISAKLNEMQWDIIGVSEDFNFNDELLSSLSNYSSGKHRG